jgi:hypothetical protein
VKNEVSHRVKEERNTKNVINIRQANWICHNSRSISILKHVLEEKMEGKIKVARRRERIRKQVLVTDLKETR